MDTENNIGQNEAGERKFRRPRINNAGSTPAGNTDNSGASRFERVNYNAQGGDNPEGAGYAPDRRQRPQQGGYQPRPYQPRQQQGGYQPRQYGNQQGGYQPRPYGQQNRYQQGGDDQYQGGYQPRQGGQQRQQGGYKPRYNQQPNHQQHDGDDYGYQPRYNQQGGYGKPRYNQQGGQQQQGNHRNKKNNNYNNQRGGYNNNNQRNQRNQRNQQPRPGKSFTPRPKRIEYEQPEVDPNQEIRLNKYMANAGICSRREADELIQKGLVKINGVVVSELGTKITAKDVVEYDEKVVVPERKCYVLLNKPKDCVTTCDDPNGMLTVMDIVKNACEERIYPVGRLDRNTTGVLLLTNDGDLASKLTHPQYVKKKIYHVWCDRDISEDDMQRIADGIELDDGPIHADAISYATDVDRNQAGIEIHSGRNRIVRRIFESLGYHVTKLDRVYFAGLTKKNLPRGRWRYLTQEEVNFLKMGSFE
jgi:23S rRNA pseudouridine2605 synthase